MNRLLLTAILACCSLLAGQSLAPAASDTQAAPPAVSAWPVLPVMPLPAQEASLPGMMAQKIVQVSRDGRTLEGALMDKDGTLLFCDVTGRRVLRLDKAGQLHTLVQFATVAPGGLALHRDGRLFIAALNMDEDRGVVVALHKDGTLTTILDAEKGYWPNDMVFDSQGGMYFTDFKGSATQPAGGVYYLAADETTITPVVQGLCQANGIGLSPDESTLWVTEFARNQLCKIDLTAPARPSPIGTSIPYRFCAATPDSLRVDAAGNVYVALYGQGRVLIFHPTGTPAGQILLPGRETGINLLCTSLAIAPDSNDLFIVSGNGAGMDGSFVFAGTALAHGQPAVR